MGLRQWTKQNECHVTIFAEEGDVTLSVPVVIMPDQNVENSMFDWVINRRWKVQRMEKQNGDKT